ncbi:hypothetical protein [Aciditerrimonas ferrireducens]|nr:hypothetical protein [Aciditerrimonas ferrireducens]MCK4177130.1 hypothetical protein [Aciditerrimonas ferrireducens]
MSPETTPPQRPPSLPDPPTPACPHRPGPPWLVGGLHPGDAQPTGTWPLAEQARFVGRTAWTLDRLFQVVGAFAADPVCDETAVAYAALARELAWHAQLLLERLPVLATLDPADLLVPDPRWAVALDGLAALPPAPAVARLAGLARGVLPRLRVELAWALGAAGADGPLVRALRHVLVDLDPAHLVFEALCQRHQLDRASAEVAAGAQARVEAGFLPGASGGA